MKTNTINYTSPEQQIEKLKSQHLIIPDENFARSQLQLYGYSNLIKSYRDPYVIISDGKKTYRSGVTFDQIFSLYLLDKNLRNAVMASMLDLEEYVKETAANVIAKSFGTHQDDYLQYKNYRNKRKSKYRFSLPGILDKLKEALNTDKDPIYHYMSKYNSVPPWILFKSVYFSTIINFIDLFKDNEQSEVAELLYSSLTPSSPSKQKLMMDTLFICMEYRNIAAHGGRTYNYICSRTVRSQEIFGADTDVASFLCGFGQLLLLLELLDYKEPFNRLEQTLSYEVNRHCSLFPQDVTYLGQVLNLNIIPSSTVYISEKSNKYHKNPHCSGIKNSQRIELADAKEKGFVACKRCVE